MISIPYIKSGDGRREALQKGEPALNAGELNYQIFYYVKHAKSFLETDKQTIYNFIKQFLGNTPNYQRYNDMTGVLVRCAKEVERRIHEIQSVYYPRFLYQLIESFDYEIAKYEDNKTEENGDVE